ncbi:glycosyl hydrolase family 28-related protein [Spirosoma utsteinense]|uniref:Rhamnogalacturonase A/B/Epimerase-like pectate lyase domain-containing protein n=1 Tax=Spirosoma utsteinense TaxID=2585773 RepID=A0ABR6WE14_9BACT|nr:glycosyl hydrolase family 28-related protein [Spirosoma utsteinense]MBC3788886.1 hypothetical protein [Spirosoma utsteinense]MBC3794793.1 hypothetical protein [Spirosoma utsteinense]
MISTGGLGAEHDHRYKSLQGEQPLLPADKNIALPISNDLHIFWASESAGPGEEIAVQGHFSILAQLCLTAGDDTQQVLVPILSQATGFIKAQIPGNLPVSVYQIWVQQSGSRSLSSFINQARGDCVDSPDVYAGAHVAIRGRDLLLSGKTAVIRFVSQSNGASLLATAVTDGSDRFKLNITAPATLVVGTKYKVYVSNGYGGSVGETQVIDETGDSNYGLTALAPATDVFGLGVAWHANFTGAMTGNVYNAKIDSRLAADSKVVGDGTTNDLPRIMKAMNKASADGGGVVYLPAGAYLCEGGGFVGLDMPPNVILKGAGKGATIIKYGTGSSISKFVYFDSGKRNSGISDLSFENQDTTGSFGSGLIGGQNVFLKNVSWKMQKGEWLEYLNVKKVLIQNCDFLQGANALIHGPTTTTNCEYVTIKGSKFTFVTGGINTTESSKCFIEDNELTRDVALGKVEGSILHLMINEFTTSAYIANNRFRLANGPIPRDPNGIPITNDGESIIAEGGGAAIPDVDYGKVSSATATTLTDTAKNWTTSFKRLPVVAIIKGRGAGQVTKIRSRTATTLTLAIAWRIVPDNTSSYAIFNFGLENVAYVNNDIRDQQRGITLYHCAMHHIDIVGNRLINAGAIDITTIQNIRPNNVHHFTPIYNVEVINNYVDGENDPYNGVSIGVQAIQHIIAQTWGTVSTNLRITHNTLIGAIPNKNVIQDESFPTGYHAYMVFHSGGTNYQDEWVPMILGTILADNTAKNCERSVILNTASYHTSVSRMKQLNAPILIDNQVLPGTKHGGVGIATHIK